jgi:hypothetical protein
MFIGESVNKRMSKLSEHSSALNRDPAFRHEAVMDEDSLI